MRIQAKCMLSCFKSALRTCCAGIDDLRPHEVDGLRYLQFLPTCEREKERGGEDFAPQPALLLRGKSRLAVVAAAACKFLLGEIFSPSCEKRLELPLLLPLLLLLPTDRGRRFTTQHTLGTVTESESGPEIRITTAGPVNLVLTDKMVLSLLLSRK